VNQQEIDFDVPNGDILRGMKVYKQACAGCHDLDYDHSMGPALRNSYLRRAGSRKNFRFYGNTISSIKLYWSK
jgi:cytochrome c